MSIFRSHSFQLFLIIIFGLFFRIATRFFFIIYVSGTYFFYPEGYSNPTAYFYFNTFPIFLILNFTIGLGIFTINSFLEKEQRISTHLVYLLFAGIVMEGILIGTEFTILWFYRFHLDVTLILYLLPISAIIISFFVLGLLSARYLITHYPSVSRSIFEMVFLSYLQFKELISSLKLVFKPSVSLVAAKKKFTHYFKEIMPVIPILIITIILRFYNIMNIGLRYWDEAYYAIYARAFILGRPIFIKPGHVILMAISFTLFGYTDYASIIPSALLGSITVLLVYDVGRKLFNRNIGIFAASILAVSEYHILYSRSALADANLTFFVALTFYIYLIGRRLGNNGQSNSIKTKDDEFKIQTLIILLSGLVASYAFAIKENVIVFIGFLFLFEIFHFVIKRKDFSNALFSIVLFAIGFIFGYFFLYFPLYIFNRWGILSFIFTSRPQSIAGQVGRNWHIAHLVHLWELTGPHIFVLMIIGLLGLFKEKKREGLFIAGWFLFMLFFWSSIPHNEPRDFAQALIPYVIISGIGIEYIVKLFLQNIRTHINFSRNKIQIAICLLIISLGVISSFDTIQLESTAYQEVSEFLQKENSKGGFTTMTTVMQFYTGRGWQWLREDSRDRLISAAQSEDLHIIIDYMYYHSSYNISMEIITKCEPIFKIYNEPASHKYTLLESFQGRAEEILNDPYSKYIYVYRVKDVVDVLYLE